MKDSFNFSDILTKGTYRFISHRQNVHQTIVCASYAMQLLSVAKTYFPSSLSNAETSDEKRKNIHLLKEDDAKDKQGNTFLHYFAKESKYAEIISFINLLKNDEDKRTILTAENKTGNSLSQSSQIKKAFSELLLTPPDSKTSNVLLS